MWTVEASFSIWLFWLVNGKNDLIVINETYVDFKMVPSVRAVGKMHIPFFWNNQAWAVDGVRITDLIVQSIAPADNFAGIIFLQYKARK